VWNSLPRFGFAFLLKQLLVDLPSAFQVKRSYLIQVTAQLGLKILQFPTFDRSDRARDLFVDQIAAASVFLIVPQTLFAIRLSKVRLRLTQYIDRQLLN